MGTLSLEDYKRFENVDTKDYQKEVKNEETILNYIQQWGSKTGRELLTDVLWLWYSKDSLPVGAVAMAIGAIGYFVAPVDLIPDAIPILGFLDDGAVIAGAIKALSGMMPPEARLKAEEQVDKILGKPGTKDGKVVINPTADKKSRN